MTLFHKTFQSLKQRGAVTTCTKIVSFLLRPYTERALEKKIFSHHDIEGRFTEIYKLNAWGSKESASGNGSTIALTEHVRSALPELFARLGTRSLFDGPCGDFNWMKQVIAEYPLDYTGADIVAPIIDSLNNTHRAHNVRFLHLDLTEDKFPTADLMICRDCIFHLSYRDTISLLRNFVAARIPYFLTSTHTDRTKFANTDIRTGGFRRIDLFAAPYHFPSDVLFRVADIEVEGKETELCLWSRDQIIDAIERFSLVPGCGAERSEASFA